MRTITIAAVSAVLALSACGRPGADDTDAEDSTAVAGDTVNAPLTVEASHILIAYSGALRADPSVTRSMDEARQLASDILMKINSGEVTFEDAAIEFSDCPSGTSGGSLGQFGRGAMVPEFETAAFGLEVGAVSGVVETDFGFHIIKRTL
jgi:hypothetical protein